MTSSEQMARIWDTERTVIIDRAVYDALKNALDQVVAASEGHYGDNIGTRLDHCGRVARAALAKAQDSA